jgi:hypothetical protein
MKFFEFPNSILIYTIQVDKIRIRDSVYVSLHHIPIFVSPMAIVIVVVLARNAIREAEQYLVIATYIDKP